MINRILKFSGSLLIRYPKLNKQLLNYKGDSLRIVYYHMISELENQPFYFKNKSISPNEFRNHIRFLKKHYNIISLDEAINHLKLNKDLTGKLVITFDDGFKENYTLIAPILEEEGVTATFFLITDCIDNKKLMWRNVILTVLNKSKKDKYNLANTLVEEFRLPKIKRKESFLDWSYRTWTMNEKDVVASFLWKEAEIGDIDSFLNKEKPYLDSNQIKTLLSQGFSIGSHSKSHPDFSKLSYDEFQCEIKESIKFLNENYKMKVNSFSYPFGERASLDYEDRFRAENNNDFLFLGISNNLSNYDIKKIERDNLEFNGGLMMFRFTLLPVFRKFLNI